MPAIAQAQDTGRTLIEEVVVTAQKRAESRQDVPIAIAAYTAEDIERTGARGLEDLAALTPGFSFVSLLGSMSGTPVIRGQTTLIGEPNVGIFLDGVYQSSRASMDALIGDIERVEIVKGPQSALYGRNTFGGAINYVTREPSEEFVGGVEATAGDFGRKDGRVSVSGPIVSDRLFFRAGALYSERDGLYTNELTGDDIDARETSGGYASLVLTPTENLRLRLTDLYERTRDDDTAQAFVRNNSGFFATRNMFQFFDGTLPRLTDGFAVTPGFFHRDNNNLSLTATLTGERVEFVSISGLNDLEVLSAVDNDYSARDIHFRNEALEQTEVSEELRLQSVGSGPIEWLAGVYYYDLDYANDSTDQFVGIAAGRGGARVIVDDGTRNYAGFGQLAYRFGGGFRIAVSGRYSKEEKSSNIREFNAVTGVQVTDLQLEDTFDSFTPKVALDYKVRDDLMLYVSAAKAVKSGGFNNTNLSGPIQPDERTYDQESSWNYEAGVKSTWSDRLIANADVFLIKWDDQIVRDLGSAGAILNSNAGQTTSRGFEAELRWKPTTNWTFGLSYAYTDAKFDEYNFAALLPLTGHDPDLSGKRLQFYPEQALSASADFDAPLAGGWNWFAHADYASQSELEASPTNDGQYDGIERVNMRIGFGNERYTFSLWVKNLTDDDALASGVLTTNYAQRYDAMIGAEPGPEILSPLLTAGEPRQVGVTVKVAF